MSKNVAVFVDVANIFYAAKAAGVDIDYVTLLKASSAGRDLVRAYAYTGLDPDNENQRNFHDFLRRSGYKVVSKDIRKYGDGKVKANLDIELVVDMMKTARNLDVAIVVSGDGDFAPAIRAVQEMGVRVEVVSFRGNTSSDLMDVADLFTDIIQIAKVERGSSRSGRRVAGDDDLSMTEVPDKQSEGTGERTRGGRGRTRRTTATPIAATSTGRGRTRAAPVDPEDAPQIVALPGEKLSRAAAAAAPGDASVGPEIEDDAEALEPLEAVEPGAAAAVGENMSEEGPRRRRRRGGRGRGRARGREEGELADAPAGPVREPVRAADAVDAEAAQAEDAEEMPAPARRAASAFGSVWDSQIGIPAARSSSATPANADEDDFDEPSVPEYLITERRQRDGNRGGARGGGRGRGGAYAAALDRERYGGGRGSRPSAFQQPAPAPREGGFNRPDRGDRNDRMDRGDRRPPFRPVPTPAPRPSGDEPWSEVPPEIEAMLRAQLGTRPAAPRREQLPAPEAATSATEAFAPAAEPAATAATSRRGRRPAADTAPETVTSTGEDQAVSPDAAPKARRTAVRKPRTATAAATDEVADATPPATKRTRATTTTRRTSAKRSTAAVPDAEAAPAPDGEAAPAPKRRAPRKKADTADTAG
ncbi:MAG TPA: NYN domain-containing protein [Candidatus Limnocylindria bacterium]|nr:NYN domain-containing protein [Candidatus Limnocylindria bacterium]